MSDPVVQEIKDRLDIAEVISEYVQLRRAGANFKGLCPFHNEKTPSFMVSRERGLWKCFGCGEGGDVFSFVQKHESLTFPEVLKILADKAGVQLPVRSSLTDYDKEAKTRDELLYINELTARFYHEALLRSKSGQIARDYLAKRGLKQETIKRWQLGFAPDDFHILEKFLLTRKVNLERAVQAGVLARGQNGNVYDRFRFRVIFPLHDYHGRTVGFTARTLSTDTKEAKYVNSPETDVYHKSKILYGLYFAKKAAKDEKNLIIVEGNMDVIASHEAGVENVVASSGTALTVDQLNLISRLTKNLIFAFDADTAGLAATRRGLELALSQGFKVRIAELLGNKDPDELIRQDVGLWQKVISKAPDFLDFSFKLAFGKINKNNKEVLNAAAEQFLEIVALLKDPILQAQEAKRVAEQLDISSQAVLDKLKDIKKKQGTVSYANTVTSARSAELVGAKARSELLEERVIGLALVEPQLRAILQNELASSDFSTLAHAFEFVIKNAEHENFTDEQMSSFQFLGEEELNHLKEIYSDSTKLKKAYVNLCRELRSLSIKEKMKKLSRLIAEKERSKNLQELQSLREEFNNLSIRLSEVSKG
jgi:DNA primase